MAPSAFDCSTVKSDCWEGFAGGEPCLLGIDEAGRGPVLGEMVYGCAVSPSSMADQLKALGVADSKALTEEKREKIFEKMLKDDETKKVVAYALRALSPQLISAAMLQRSKCSLNQLSHDAAIQLIRDALEAKINVVEILVDTVGPKQKYQAKLEALFPGISITVTEKADSKFPVVSAASIAAKVTRDRQLRAWTFKENSPLLQNPAIGSGYPGDPVTKKFLARSVDGVFGYPGLVRFSWKTVDTILDKKAVTLEWEADADDAVGSSKSLSKMWTTTSSSSSEKKTRERRHPFFTDRKLTNTSVF